MDLYKELVHGKGYAVFSIENMQIFEKLRDSFIAKINISNGAEKNIDKVRKVMAEMSKAEINKTMIK